MNDALKKASRKCKFRQAVDGKGLKESNNIFTKDLLDESNLRRLCTFQVWVLSLFEFTKLHVC